MFVTAVRTHVISTYRDLPTQDTKNKQLKRCRAARLQLIHHDDPLRSASIRHIWYCRRHVLTETSLLYGYYFPPFAVGLAPVVASANSKQVAASISIKHETVKQGSDKNTNVTQRYLSILLLWLATSR